MITFLALGITSSLTSSEGPDEVAHYYFNRFVVKYGRVPLTTDERLEAGYKADLPPLYYLLVGTAGRGIDLESSPHLKITRDNSRLQLVAGHSNIKGWRLIKTEDPFQGEVLLWYLGRWMALLCGLAGLAMIYFLIRTTQPGHPWLALGAVSLLAFLPTYGYISSITSYEPLTGLLMASYFLLLFYVIKYPNRSWLYFGLGLLVGLAAATRQTVWAILPLVPIIIIWLAYRQRWPWRTTLWRLALLGLGLLLTFGAWMLYISLYFNRVDELGWFQGLISPILIGDGSGKTSLQIAGMMTGGEIGIDNLSRQSDTFLQWVWHFFSGIWGGSWLGWVMVGIWGLAIAGIVRQWRRETEGIRLWIVLLILNIGLLLFFPFLRFVFSGQASTAMSQHLLFPAAAAMMVLLIYGLRAWLTPKWITALLFVLAAVNLWLSVEAVPYRYQESLPVQTVPLSTNEHVLATFDTVSLIDLDYVAGDKTLEVTLVWRAEALSNEDDRIKLTLLDGAGQAQARWIGQPLNGRYPTRAWTPEDRVRDVIELPIAGLAEGDYRLQLQFLNDSGVISSAEGEVLDLGQVNLKPALAESTETVLLGDQSIGYTFWRQGKQENPVYRENATVIVSTQERLGETIKLKLVGPDEQPRDPVDHTGRVYNFSVAPHFTNGNYRLRVEQWNGDELVAHADTPPLFQVETEARQFEVSPISNPVSANYAGYVSLLGYDLPQPQVQPGDTVPITLYWQAHKTIGADLVTFNHLVDEQGNVYGGRDRIAREVYSTMFWVPGEIVADPFNLQVDATVPDGVYYILVGLYLPVGESAVSLPLLQDDQLSEVTSVRIGPLKIGQTPPDLIVARAEPQVILNQPFGDIPNLTLLGYDLAEQQKESEVGLELTLYWQVESSLSKNYTTFVHLHNDVGQIVAQQDQAPLSGAYPTGVWSPGEIIADKIDLSLPAELPSGKYTLVIGMYDFVTGTRLTVPDSNNDSVPLKTFEVP